MMIHPLQGGIKVVCPVRSDPGDKELCPDEVAQYLLQRLAVLFIDAEKEKGQHQADHQQCRHIVPDTAPRKHIRGYADQTACADANELALGQVERYLCFYSGKVLRDRDKGHDFTFLLSAARPGCPA